MPLTHTDEIYLFVCLFSCTNNERRILKSRPKNVKYDNKMHKNPKNWRKKKERKSLFVKKNNKGHFKNKQVEKWKVTSSCTSDVQQRCTDPTRWETGNRKRLSLSPTAEAMSLLQKNNIHLPGQKLTCSSWRSLPVDEEGFLKYFTGGEEEEENVCVRFFFLTCFFFFSLRRLRCDASSSLPVSGFSFISIHVF